MTEEEKKAMQNLLKKLSYCELEYQQNGYLSVGKFNAIKEAINLIEKQQKDLEKKDKVIDKMADSFAQNMQGINEEYSVDEEFLNKEKIKQYFYRKVEEHE